MKLGFAKAVTENPNSDMYWLWMDGSVIDDGSPARAAWKNRLFWSNYDDTDAAVMRLMGNNENYRSIIRRHGHV